MISLMCNPFVTARNHITHPSWIPCYHEHICKCLKVTLFKSLLSSRLCSVHNEHVPHHPLFCLLFSYPCKSPFFVTTNLVKYSLKFNMMLSCAWEQAKKTFHLQNDLPTCKSLPVSSVYWMLSCHRITPSLSFKVRPQLWVSRWYSSFGPLSLILKSLIGKGMVEEPLSAWKVEGDWVLLQKWSTEIFKKRGYKDHDVLVTFPSFFHSQLFPVFSSQGYVCWFPRIISLVHILTFRTICINPFNLFSVCL